MTLFEKIQQLKSELQESSSEQYKAAIIEKAAKRLLHSARIRAPSFVLLNYIFNTELEQWTECEDTRQAVREKAREILAQEE